MPYNLTLDSQGGVWVAALDDSEYDPGVWYRPAGASSRFQYLTNSRANNWLEGDYNNVVVKPQLDTDVLYAVRDDAGNVWYAMDDRRVLVEKANDGGWQTFTLSVNSSANVDSAHKIRLVDNPAGGQNALLIASRSITMVTPDFNAEELRREYRRSNIYFVKDAFIDSRGGYWVCSESGLEKGTSMVLTTFVADIAEYSADPDVPQSNVAITGIAEDTLGNMWFVSGDYGASGVHCLTTGGDWLKFDIKNNPGPSNQVMCMEAGPNGVMWFGFNKIDQDEFGGIASYTPDNGGTWSRTSCASLGLDSEFVIDMRHQDGVLWFVTDIAPNYGSGVHALKLSDSSVTSFSYRETSTTLTSHRINAMAGDLSGGVWFGAYDLPSVARMKADGTWVQYIEDTMGSGGIHGMGTDSKNIVYIAPVNRPLIAYDVTNEQWVSTIPDPPITTPYPYSLYVDPKDGKWLCCSYAVYYLNPDNDAWTTFDNTGIIRFPHSNGDTTDFYVENGAFMDRAGNMWFGTRYGIALMEIDPAGGDPTWRQFQRDDGSGYTGGYRVFLDGRGQVWNSAQQLYDFDTHTWADQADTTLFTTRPLRFDNGGIPADMSLAGALPHVSSMNQDLMTIDTAGNIYFAGGNQPINAGIVVRSPETGDIDRDGEIGLGDAVMAMQSMAGTDSEIQSTPADVTGDGKVDASETLYVLQMIAGFR